MSRRVGLCLFVVCSVWSMSVTGVRAQGVTVLANKQANEPTASEKIQEALNKKVTITAADTPLKTTPGNTKGVRFFPPAERVALVEALLNSLDATDGQRDADAPRDA